MKKNLIVSGTILLFGLIVITGSSLGNSNDKEKKNKAKKGKEKGTVIQITESDTLINGNNFRNLSKKEKEEFLKNNEKFEFDRNNFEIEMEKFSKEMEKMNKEIIILNDSIEKNFSYSFNDGENRIIIRSPKPPHPPRAPRSPKHSRSSLEFMEAPELPELPGFSSDRVFTTSPRAEDENAQVYIFKEDGKNIVIKLMKASPKDLKKIGVKEEENVSMFPNPAKDQITLNFNFSDSAPVTINIYDIEGKLVKSEIIKDYKSGNYEKTYSMSEFENGTYLVEFVQNKTKVVRKISIQR